MQIWDVRREIAEAARAVVLPGGTKTALTCTGYVPDDISEPHFFVGEYGCEYDRAMNRGMDKIEITCRVLVGRADDKASQQLVDLMLSGAGAASLKQAIEASRGSGTVLGGTVADVWVQRQQGYRWYEHAGVRYVGAELIVIVIGKGTT